MEFYLWKHVTSFMPFERLLLLTVALEVLSRFNEQMMCNNNLMNKLSALGIVCCCCDVLENHPLEHVPSEIKRRSKE